MNRRGFFKMMTAGVLVMASMRLSSAVDLIVGRVKPPVGMYVYYDDMWNKLRDETSPMVNVEHYRHPLDLATDEQAQRVSVPGYNHTDRCLDPIPDDEAQWLAHDSFKKQAQSKYPGGVYDMIYVAPEWMETVTMAVQQDVTHDMMAHSLPQSSIDFIKGGSLA